MALESNETQCRYQILLQLMDKGGFGNNEGDYDDNDILSSSDDYQFIVMKNNEDYDQLKVMRHSIDTRGLQLMDKGSYRQQKLG